MIQVKVKMDIDHSQFSAREKEVIDLLLQGKSNKQIAFELHIAQSTVEYHLKNIYHKLEVASRTEAVLRLGKSTGHDTSGELGEIPVEIDSKVAGNDGKPISMQRMPVKKMYRIIAGLLIVLVATITLFDVFTPEGTPTSVPTLAATDIPTTLSTPQASATTPVLGTPTATATSQPTSTQSQDQDEYLREDIWNVFVLREDSQCLPKLCRNLLQYLVNPGDVDNPEKIEVYLRHEFGAVREFIDTVEGGNPWERLYSAAVFTMTINRDPSPRTEYKKGSPHTDPSARPAFDAYLEFLNKLWGIRDAHPALRMGSLTELKTPSSRLAYARKYEDETIVVVFNLTDTSEPVEIDLGSISCSSGKDLLNNAQTIEFDATSLSVTLDPWKSSIIECKGDATSPRPDTFDRAIVR